MSTYKDGVKNGLCKEYDYYRRVICKCYYKNDKLHGLFEQYQVLSEWDKIPDYILVSNSNSIEYKTPDSLYIKVRCNYKDGILHGLYERFRTLALITFYDDESSDKLDCLEIDKKCTYINGILNGKYFERDFINYNNIIKTYLTDGICDGEYYNKDIDHIIMGNFKRGNPIGKFTYHKNWMYKEEIHSVIGNIEYKICKYYSEKGHILYIEKYRNSIEVSYNRKYEKKYSDIIIICQ